MIGMLFCAAVTISAIFNHVEAGICSSQPAVDEGQIEGQQSSARGWLFNMGVLRRGTHNNICPAVGIRPTNPRDPIKVVTTASCIRKTVLDGSLLARICGELHEVADIRTGPDQTVFVHPHFVSAEATPQFDIAFVKFPRVGYLSGDLNDWMQLPSREFGAPHAAGGYSSAYRTCTSRNGRYALKEKNDNLEVVSGGSGHGLFTVVGDLKGAITGAPLYMGNGGTERTLFGLYHSSIPGTHHNFVSVGPHVDWIRSPETAN